MTVLPTDPDICRSCGTPILWCVTDRLKDMPVNAAPEPGGNLSVLVDESGRTRCVVVKPDLAFGRVDLHKSHFASCPQAPKWRQR